MEILVFANFLVCASALRIGIRSPDPDYELTKEQDYGWVESMNMSASDFQNMAHVYVVNLDRRKDKCKCMQNVLSSSVFPLFRWSAVDAKQFRDACPNLTQGRVKGSRNALFCSNYILWDKVSNSDSPPSYIIVLEDDAILNRNWEEKVTQLLKEGGKCGHPQWDVIRVDMLYPGHGGQKVKCGDTALKATGGGGTHMTIYRTESLPKLLRMTQSVTFDHVNYRTVNATEVAWSPGISKQLTKDRASNVPSGCARKYSSDIDAVHQIVSHKYLTYTLPCPGDSPN